ncbi:MAG: endoribonuclease YicC domain-containing protein [Cetobacterium sp.]
MKCNLYDISKLIVECKNEIEKIREQALNIE